MRDSDGSNVVLIGYSAGEVAEDELLKMSCQVSSEDFRVIYT